MPLALSLSGFFMISIVPTSTETVAIEQPSTIEPDKEPVTLSAFIADALRAKNSAKSWYQQSNKDSHHKTPNRPPHGTRRSMGKR